MPVGEPMGDENTGPICPGCGRALPQSGVRCPWCGRASYEPAPVRTLTPWPWCDGLLGFLAAAAPPLTLLRLERLDHQGVVNLVSVPVLCLVGLVVFVRRPDLRTFRRAFALTLTLILTPFLAAIGLLTLCAVTVDPIWFFGSLSAAVALFSFVFWLMRAAYGGSRP